MQVSGNGIEHISKKKTLQLGFGMFLKHNKTTLTYRRVRKGKVCEIFQKKNILKL